MAREWQSHGGAVNTSTTPSVQYAYSEMPSGANHSRLTSITYPDGYVLTYNYASGLNGDISRLSSLSDAGGTLESYDYLGLGTVVRRSHSTPAVDLTFLGTGPGSGGDQYVGLDSFGRIIDHNWKPSGSSSDRFTYTYDRDGNRLTKGNSVNSSFNESYSYDSLNQLTNFTRGAHTQAFDFDALGNFDSVTTDGGSPQTRTHNKQNEVTAVSGATSPTFDANGNMTTDETGKQYVYDAWNRLKVVKNSGGTTLKTYVYDAMGRRVAETASGATTDLYYSKDWQVLEERDAARTNDTKIRYVWSPVYVDAMVLRDRDTADDGTLEERLWVQQDANFNVTALTNSSGTVVERYVYDPFGVATVLNASWSSIGSSAYGWQYLHQGGRLDATSGLYHFRMRDYSPTLGRWATKDPINFGGGDINLYAFVANNSIRWSDPTGTERRIDDASDLTWKDFDLTNKPSNLKIPNPGAAVIYQIRMEPVEWEITGMQRMPIPEECCFKVMVKVTKVKFYLVLTGAWSFNRSKLTEEKQRLLLNHERGHIANGLYIVRKYNEAFARRIAQGKLYNYSVKYCPTQGNDPVDILRNLKSIYKEIVSTIMATMGKHLERANDDAAAIDRLYDSDSGAGTNHGTAQGNQEIWDTRRDRIIDDLYDNPNGNLWLP